MLFAGNIFLIDAIRTDGLEKCTLCVDILRKWDASRFYKDKQAANVS